MTPLKVISKPELEKGDHKPSKKSQGKVKSASVEKAIIQQSMTEKAQMQKKIDKIY